ncbi:Pycsar system effector family protein [Streptomyces lydicamycinicus]|uniref:Pycsar system effector family protein n=1 Tax=Streptomyces lydicamycinicus TaxID=1546107 RepID=UPI003C2C2C31
MTTTTDTTDDARMTKAIDQTQNEITRADAKATALLTAFSVPVAALAVLVAVVPGREMAPAAVALISVGGVGLVVAMLAVLLVVLPRITGAPRGSYLYWAQCATADDVLEDLRTETRGEHLIRLSQIARRKYRQLRAAVCITAGALLCLAAALPVALA